MFEGLVRQLLLGYLGRYIKDIHKDQLKITVWNEEVLLENVELILEAFEYLQLPFALKQGRVGRLSIKIPWKKLGREPIIIMLESVFISVSQRSDQEWSSDAVERREFAGKKAKLAAAELAKLSRRVCDSPAGNLFMSYIAAKILDSIQVSIRNFHVLYYDTQPESVPVILGLRFSSLTVTRQNFVGPSLGRVRGGQVNKLVEIEALEIYCDTYEGNADFLSVDSKGVFDIWCDSRLQSDKVGYLLKPVRVGVTLLVNRSGELGDDQPQYSVTAELTDVVMTLNEFQLQQIMILLDYLQTSQLRERYGRYRPSSNSLSRKPPGWQKLWWHYAQESILFDVRKKLRKTSWRFLGQRLSKRRMYINLYKIKLEFLQREQSISDPVLLGLEEVEKESDIDDILSYRSVAEGEMQEAFSDITMHMGGSGVNASEKQQSDDRSSNRSRGWLNWLSRGMLGAGGTDDSSQFSGVVSDEIVKDIHEATKFHPLASSPRNIGASDKICTCSVRLKIRKISAVLQSVYGHSCQVVTELGILGVVVDCKFSKGFTAVTASVLSGRLFYPQNGKEILTMKGACSESDALEVKPSYGAQVEVSQDHDVELSLKVTLQPLEATYDVDFFLAVSNFFFGSRSFKLQHERVLSSLNGLDDKTRLSAKAKYLLSNRDKIKLDVSIKNIILRLPGVEPESYNLVFVLESLYITSNSLDSLNPNPREWSYIVDGFQSSVTSINDLQIKDLYDHFEINLCGFEVRVTEVQPLDVIPVLERSSISINLVSCIVPEEPSLKQLEVAATLSTIDVHFSPSVCQAVMSVIQYLDIWNREAHNATSDADSVHFAFTINANLALLKLHVNLANNEENSTMLILSLRELDLWYSLSEFEEWSILMKALEMIACSENGADCHSLCSSGNLLTSSSAYGRGVDVQCSNHANLINNMALPEDVIRLHYKAYRSVDFVHHKCTIFWRSTELHCYPYIFGLLADFLGKISSNKISSTDKNQGSPTTEFCTQKEVPWFGFERFGFSNFIEKSSCGCIPMDKYPFVTIYNSGSLGSLDSSLCYSIPDWRKIFCLRNKKDWTEGSLDCQGEKCDCSSNVFSSSRGFGQTTLFTVEAHIFDASVHFHDSSSIFGTIILPVSKYMLTISDDLVDLVSSVENLMLKQPLWTNYFDGFLWGHSSPNLSPVLNVRVRKGNLKTSSSELEVSIGIQHSCCILLPEYLAIIIGYFSLPGWTSMSGTQSITHSTDLIDPLSELAITYKFEILDSTLILPVENDDCQHLKVDIRQLYINFTPDCALCNVVQHVPQECVIPLNQVAGSIDCLSIFGRDLSLSLLLSKNGSLSFEQHTECTSITLASPISADVWIRIPCDHYSYSTSTCIMGRVGVCEIMADDSNALLGFKAILDVIDQVSLVDEQSKLFTSDVPQFLRAQKHLKQERAVVPLESFPNYVEVRCFVNLLRLKLHRVRKEVELLKPVIQTDMKFLFSGTFENNMPVSLEIQFFYVGLYSLLNSVMLARCANLHEDYSVLGIRFTKQEVHGYELWFALPSLDIWLYYFDWTEVIELLSSCVKVLEHSGQDHVLSGGSNPDMFDFTEVVKNGFDNTDKVSSMLEFGQSDNSSQGMTIALKAENIGVRIHFPLCSSGTTSPGLMGTEMQERFVDENVNIYKGKYCKYISVTAFNESGELFFLGRNVKVSCKFEKIIGTVSTSGVEAVESCSLFGVEQLLVETEIQMDQRKIVNVGTEILSDHVEMHLSHQVLSFWHGVAFDGPEMVSSQSKQGNTNAKVQIRDVSVLISDGRLGCGGLLLEVLMRNFFLLANLTEKNVESTVSCELQVNYNNMHKVLWEPFIEPWNFDVKLARKIGINALLNKSGLTEIVVASTAQLNVNLTESLFECIFRTIEMAENAWGLMGSDGIPDSQGLSMTYCMRNSYGERYAPYVFQNLTSLPLLYQVFQAHNSDVLDMSSPVLQSSVQPGASVPINLDDSNKQLFYHGDRRCFSRKPSSGVTHHYMRVQLDGTFVASPPCSIDRIGLSYFEVDFSKTSNDNANVEETSKAGLGNGFVVPVVFEVSLQRQSKFIRVYSTVIILNSTSMPLELRFDIPFGLSPKILDPISPGQEFPLPLHLAEAGRLRWRPLGDSYLWSEAHSISKLLSQKSKIGFRRSFACYPCHPSNEPFRCCISVQTISLPASFHFNDLPDGKFGRRLHDVNRFRERFIHQVTLSTPLVVRNCLPEPISLTVESGGITQSALLSEGDAPFHHSDPSHDLMLEFKMDGFGPARLKFPRSETFSAVAKFSGGKFSQTETVSFDSDFSGGSVYVSFEKTVDITCGAREVSVFVPFLLYNCTGTPLIVSNCSNEAKGTSIIVPSCYNLFEQNFVQSRKEGLGILSCEKDFSDRAPIVDAPSSPSSSESGIANSDSDRLVHKPVILSTLDRYSHKQQEFPADRKGSAIGQKRNMSSKSLREACFLGNDDLSKVKACIYSPCAISSASDILIRVQKGLPGSDNANRPHSLWSAPFSLVPPSGSTSVIVPQSSPSQSFLLSVTCSILGGAFGGRTQAITFQPRYVICNSCSKDLCYKQKGTNLVTHLAVGQHSQLHWTDTTRELLVSIRFNEPGWQWSGSFLPDHLGDTQLKMWNYVTSALNMVRVEVQNADISSGNEKIAGNIRGNVGTNLILLSDDDMGYMPYRIDNFSKERLRVYQQKCETFDTIVHPYTSCPYAWDEPCYPHRLTIEVPGNRVIGSYTLDITKQPIPVLLRSTSEKPERTLLLSVCAEGATKVLSIVDSGYHATKDIEEKISSKFQEKRNQKLQKDNVACYTENFLLVLPSIGISLINSQPQELIYACVSNVVFDLSQSLDQQKLSFQISSLQIDNPLYNSSYPVILSFNHEQRSIPSDWGGIKDTKGRSSGEIVQQTRSKTHDAVLYAGLAKWRKKDASLVSLEHIHLRIADFCLELELETILSLLEFVKAVLPESQSRLLPFSDPTLHPLVYDTGSAKDTSVKDDPPHARNIPVFNKSQRSIVSFPSIIPIGAPWQQIYLLARRHRKIYVEMFELAPVKFTLSFSSAPWMLRHGVLTSGDSLIHRGLMALADVEGARIHLKQLTIVHHMSSVESFQEILIGHYTRQILHELYKVFGSAGVIGNPMGFARNVALGVKDFLSAPARGVSKSPKGLIQGMAQGTTSLLSSTVYALSDAATQFSKAAHKGIVAFTFNDHDVARMENQQKGEGSHSKGVIGEVFEGLTGLLESPIRGAEKHGLPGVVSGIALGITGLVARPTASILEVTGKTAQSIRNRSRLHSARYQRRRLRLPRPLNRELPLRPYSWEEAVGTAVLTEVGDNLKLKGEILIKCKALKRGGDFVVVTGRSILVVISPSLADFRGPGFQGVPVDLEWKIEREIGLESVIHVDSSGGVVHIVGSSFDSASSWRQTQQKKSRGQSGKLWNPSSSSASSSSLPLRQTTLELPTEEEADELLQILLSTIEASKKSRGWNSRFVLHQSNLS
ncbi:PREDICTED: uncharacterized protein LOC104814962 [Tarenaya hassleriana]|uniref:uncharacterized protein LOC104814962 n=1 Tax=Tarenaya hassleriana TaxID=28532 RepID=UPI0008FD3846|nr:PREDICTED: uncharacterized protein LOC104814962 [Tarenaya hassleriana]